MNNKSSNLDSDTLAYMKTKQFKKDKVKLQETLDGYRKNGTKNFVNHEEVWGEIDKHTRALMQIKYRPKFTNEEKKKP